MLESKEPLSERELDILRLVATGAPNKEIARQLYISPNTVKVHLRNIFAKIGVTSRTEATLYAVQIGLVNPGATAAAEPAASEPATSGSGTIPPLATPSNGHDASGAGLPDISIEDQARSTAPAGSIKPRQIVLAALGAVLLIVVGMLGSRLLLQSNLLPTTVASLFRTPEVTASRTAASGAEAQTQIASSRWSDKESLPAPRKGMGAVTYESYFYMIGGETAQGIDGALFSYDPVQNIWKGLAQKPTPVTDIQAALLGERIYVPGGRLADGKDSNVLEVYDPRQNTWETRAPLPAPLSGYASATFEGDLYLFGGKNGSQYLSTVYQYDPKTDQWSQRAAMSSPRAYAAAIDDGEKIFVIGGYDGKHALALNEVYFPTRDPGADKPWETLAPMPSGRYGMGIAQMVNIVFLLGGYQENKAPATPPGIQFIARSNQWLGYDAPAHPVGAYPALFASGNFLYIFGGETTSGLLASGQAYQAIYTISNPIQIKP